METRKANRKGKQKGNGGGDYPVPAVRTGRRAADGKRRPGARQRGGRAVCWLAAVGADAVALADEHTAGRALDDARAVRHALPAVRAMVRVGRDRLMAVDAPDAGLDVHLHHLAFQKHHV